MSAALGTLFGLVLVPVLFFGGRFLASVIVRIVVLYWTAKDNTAADAYSKQMGIQRVALTTYGRLADAHRAHVAANVSNAADRKAHTATKLAKWKARL